MSAEFEGIGPKVVCKFRFTEMSTKEGWNDKKLLYDLKFVAVTGTRPGATEEDKKFWEWSPSGEFHFTTINAEAAKIFQFGHEYYFVIQEAPPKTCTPPPERPPVP